MNRKLIRIFIVLSLGIIPLLVVQPALAQCVPDPANAPNQIVNCTGAENDGIQSAQLNTTVNVANLATVTDAGGPGVSLSNGNVLNNNGGTISSTSAASAAVAITAGAANNLLIDINNNTAASTITSLANALNATANGDGGIDVYNNGAITGNSDAGAGAGFGMNLTDNGGAGSGGIVIYNDDSGVVTANGAGNTAVSATVSGAGTGAITLTNDGRIDSNAQSAIILTGGTGSGNVTATNNGTVEATSLGIAVEANEGGNATVNNAGTATISSSTGIRVRADDGNADVNVTGGTVSATSGEGIFADLSEATDAGNVEEQRAVKIAGVDRARGTGGGNRQRRARVERDLQVARQSVARSAGHDAKRHVGRRHAGGRAVDGAITTPRDDEVDV